MNYSGEPIVEALQGLQVLADNIDDPEHKMTFIKRRLQMTRIGEILGSRLFVGAHSVLMQTQDMYSRDRIRFSSRLAFLGGLEAVTYMYDPDMPVDSLALVFETPQIFSASKDAPDREVSPEVIQIDMADFEAFERSRLTVPVLSIDTCDLLSA